MGGESNEVVIKFVKIYIGNFEIVGLGGSWYGMMVQVVGVQYCYGCKGYGFNMLGMLVLLVLNKFWFLFYYDGVYDWEKEMMYGWVMIDMQFCGLLVVCIVECIQLFVGIYVFLLGYF